MSESPIAPFNKIICPVCEKQGLKSTVRIEKAWSFAMVSNSFYDEQGRYHDHDPNDKCRICQCSNGHMFENRDEHACWCGDWRNWRETKDE